MKHSCTTQIQSAQKPKIPVAKPKLKTETPSNKEKGLLERHVAVCCALKKYWRPLFRIGSTQFGGIVSLKDTRMKKNHQDIIDMKIAGEK